MSASLPILSTGTMKKYIPVRISYRIIELFSAGLTEAEAKKVLEPMLARPGTARRTTHVQPSAWLAVTDAGSHEARRAPAGATPAGWSNPQWHWKRAGANGGTEGLVRMRLLASVAAIVVLSLVPSIAGAQEAQKGFIGALGGFTLGSATNGAVAAQAGAQIAPGLFVVGELGYIRNALPKGVRDDIDRLVDIVSAIYGAPVSLRLSAPVTYGFGGVRLNPMDGTVEPFLEAGAGVGRVSVKIVEASVQGNDLRGLMQAALDDEESSTTKLLLTAGGGVTMRPSAALAVDIGYRYSRIATDDPAVNVSMIYAALKVGF